MVTTLLEHLSGHKVKAPSSVQPVSPIKKFSAQMAPPVASQAVLQASLTPADKGILKSVDGKQLGVQIRAWTTILQQHPKTDKPVIMAILKQYDSTVHAELMHQLGGHQAAIMLAERANQSRARKMPRINTPTGKALNALVDKVVAETLQGRTIH